MFNEVQRRVNGNMNRTGFRGEFGKNEGNSGEGEIRFQTEAYTERKLFASVPPLSRERVFRGLGG